MKQKTNGKKAEKLAAAYLSRHGIRIVASNYRCSYGEIDLIGWEKDYLVFIEVKARKSLACGYPGEAVNFAKQKKICQTSLYYCYKEKIDRNCPIRFDVVEILEDKIRHTKNAFSYC